MQQVSARRRIAIEHGGRVDLIGRALTADPMGEEPGRHAVPAFETVC
jgi:hypothetical protein